MFDQFMQMGAGAAFVLAVTVGCMAVVSTTAIVNRTIRQSKILDTEIKRQEIADTARQIEHKP